MTRMLDLIPRTRELMPFIPDSLVFDRLFDDLFYDNKIIPAFDISETDKEYLITAEVPGIDVKDIDITLSDGILSIKGEKKKEDESKETNYHCIERHYGSFERRFKIPESVKTDKLDATYNQGILKLSLPKSGKAKARQIEVRKEGKTK